MDFLKSTKEGPFGSAEGRIPEVGGGGVYAFAPPPLKSAPLDYCIRKLPLMAQSFMQTGKIKRCFKLTLTKFQDIPLFII